MAKFYIGDTVKAKRNAPYGVTRDGWLGVVIETSERFHKIRVKELDGSWETWVDLRYFDLYKPGEARLAPFRSEDGKLICAECGCIIEDETEMQLIDDKVYCSDCVEREFTICEECGSLVRKDELEEVDGHMLCETCRDDDSVCFICQDCEELHMRRYNDYILLGDGSMICESCAQSGDYVRCENCEEWFRVDDMEYDEEDDDYYCPDCMDSRKRRSIKSYGYKPDPIFKAGTHDKFYTDESIKELLFGVELEIDKGNDPGGCATDIINATEDVYCKHDGSLRDGVEIVTHPCTLEYHMKSLGWEKISKIAESYGFKSQNADTCGLHVHVGRNQMGKDYDEQDETAAKIVLLADRHWDSIFEFSRRKSYYAERWASRPNINYDSVRYGESLKDAALNTVHAGRYQTINLENENTVEFRIFNGTLKVSTIYATLQLVSNLVTYAKEHSYDEVMKSSWKDITGVKKYKELEEYLENRELVEGKAPKDVNIEPVKIEGVAEEQPEHFKVGDEVIVVNAAGSDVGSLRSRIGRRARVIRVFESWRSHEYAIDFGEESWDLHSCNGMLDRDSGYNVHRQNIALAA